MGSLFREVKKVNPGPYGQFECDYPSRNRIEAINTEIDNISKSIGKKIDGWESVLPGISACLVAFAELRASNGYQVLGWIRLAAVFRRKAIEGDGTACDAFAALYFLNQSRKSWHKEEKLSELNWVQDRALDQLGMNFEGGWIYNAITKEEMHSIQQTVLRTAEIDRRCVGKIASKISTQVKTIRGLKIIADITDFDQKLEALIEAAGGDGVESGLARAAIVYLAETDDVIPDDLGILGLLDDLYVIEWAYATVEEQAYGLPHLSSLQQRIPHLESSYLTAGGMMLDRFGQYVVGNAQAVLESTENDHIALRDADVFLAPVVGALTLSAMHENAQTGANVRWEEGTILNLLNFGQRPERVRYLGHKVIAGDEKIVVEVNSSGRLYLPVNLATCMETSPRQDYKTLSNGSAVSTWQQHHSVDPLHFLLKGRPRSDARRAVLVVAPRNLLEYYLPSLHCRGEAISKVVGATWVSGTEREEPMSQSVIDRAMIYACGSAMVARNLIENPPAGVVGFDLIAFGSQAYREINAEFVGREIPNLRMLCLADISEVPGPPRDALVMEDDVVLPWSLRPRGFRQTDPLARGLKRQYNHWIVDRRVQVFPNPALSTINKFLQDRHDDPEDDFSPIVQQLRSFLSDMGKMPRPGSSVSAKLRERALILSRAAKAEALYDQSLVGIAHALGELSENCKFSPDVFGETIAKEGRPVTILCRSHQEAQETTSLLKENGFYGAGLTAPELFRDAPVEHLVVPGWHGAETMRRLDTINPAIKLDYLMFDFQEEWLERVTEGVRRRVRSFSTPIEHSNEGREASGAGEQLVWPSPKRNKSAPSEELSEFIPPTEKRPDLDGLFKGIHRTANYGSEAKVSGIPVILDDYSAYMFLPPHADLVLLNRDASRPEDACIPVSQLREGDVFVLKDGSHRELFQELAPNYLRDPNTTLKMADLWRQPLKQAYAAGSVPWSNFRKRLASVGLHRSDMAYRNWISGQTVAPMNYRAVIPKICTLSDDPEIQKSGEASAQAVSALYRARHEAADHIFEQLVKGTADQTTGKLRIEVGSTCIDLNVHRVEYVGQVATCAGVRRQSFSEC
ncbi:DUF1232 domain-containing protein [Aliiroseovarius sp. M344]|uniref:DUF1232 domain-containing protein n=1 Tax=Aliiroseovarius sp. M344 TaxID=2867010 RepID=UPI0021ADE594|nr:DUF1232 domain-containing protein [Aliiroseovarius sp. M344]UWQ14149.1 DUF1232 domain-containing protein [Aliiroseovarius sp. M344]